ncbi:hypothetical protein GQX74_001893 [Glossina fuscipes]|nr:hypothetical protein GQX74_001893 [Glossina fuscipes]
MDLSSQTSLDTFIQLSATITFFPTFLLLINVLSLLLLLFLLTTGLIESWLFGITGAFSTGMCMHYFDCTVSTYTGKIKLYESRQRMLHIVLAVCHNSNHNNNNNSNNNNNNSNTNEREQLHKQ